MPTLFENTSYIHELERIAASAEGDDLEAINAMILDAREAFDIKVASTVKYIKNLESDLPGYEEAIRDLKEGKKALENKIDRLKKLLNYFIEPGKKWQHGVHKISWRKSEALVIDNVPVEMLPEAFQHQPPKEINKPAVREHLDGGGELAFARYEVKNNIQVK